MGLASALAAAERGLQVTVIDQERPGAASRAAAGMLAPTVEGLAGHARRAALSARDLYPDYVARLTDRTGIEIPLDRRGVLELARDDAELERRWAAWRAAGAAPEQPPVGEHVSSAGRGAPPEPPAVERTPRGGDITSGRSTRGDDISSRRLHHRDDHPAERTAAQWMDGPALAALEPGLAGHAGALLHPLDGAVDNVALMNALDAATSSHPRIQRRPAEISAIRRTPAAVSAVCDPGGLLSAPRLLYALGAWAGALPAMLPRPIPVRPVAGELLRLEGRHVAHVTYGAGGYLVPRGETLIVGATSEERGFDSRTTGAGRRTLADIARQIIPALSAATVLAHWAGLRPVSPDGLPILGADPDDPRLLYAVGLSRNGILFAPWAAELLAILAAENTAHPDLAPFRITRFSSH